VAETAGKLNQEQKDRVIDWFNKKWTARSKDCPICTTNGWELSEYVVQPVTQSPVGQMNLGGAPAYPAVLLICKTCGYTMAFNAVMIGLFAKTTEAADVAK
jgi:hypothetical protein